MPRKITSPNGGNNVYNRLQPYEGGSGQLTAGAALTAFNAVPAAVVNQANGIAGLDDMGKLSGSALPINVLSVDSVNGPASVVMGSVNTYTITNYDAFETYELSAISGSVSRNGAEITFIAPGALGATGFNLNGRTFNLTTTSYKPNTPTISAVDQAGDPASVNATGSAFTMNGGSNTHQNSDWQIATDSAFVSVVASSMADATNKTSWTGTGLPLSTTYYVRVRYRDNQGNVSDWSNIATATTKSSYVPSLEESLLVAPGQVIGATFGYSSAMTPDGNFLVVGAPYIDPLYNGLIGRVYIYKRTGTSWTLTGTIDSPYSSSDHFGKSVAVTSDGNLIAVGTGNANNSANKVDIYLLAQGNPVGTVYNNEYNLSGSLASAFGFSLSFNSVGSMLAVGAPGASDGDGSISVYKRTFDGQGYFWQTVTINGINFGTGSQTGTSVSMSPDGLGLVVGAPLHNNSGGVRGAVQVLKFNSGTNTWEDDSPLISTQGLGGNDCRFGASVHISDDRNRIVVGAFNDRVGTGGSGVNGTSGSVWIYRRTTGSTWVLEQKILPTFGSTGGGDFGWRVKFNSDASILFATSPYDRYASTPGPGAIYIFSRTGSSWAQSTAYTGTNAIKADYYGFDISTSSDGSRVAVSAPYRQVGATPDVGGVFIYR